MRQSSDGLQLWTFLVISDAAPRAAAPLKPTVPEDLQHFWVGGPWSELSPGRCQVLHFRPTLLDQWSQRPQITSGELLPDQPVPSLKRRREPSRSAIHGG